VKPLLIFLSIAYDDFHNFSKVFGREKGNNFPRGKHMEVEFQNGSSGCGSMIGRSRLE
jgi:hypothetical protein